MYVSCGMFVLKCSLWNDHVTFKLLNLGLKIMTASVLILSIHVHSACTVQPSNHRFIGNRLAITFDYGASRLHEGLNGTDAE